MVNAPVIPDSHVIDILPLQTDLQVMVLDDEVDKPIEKMAALGLAEPMDAFDVLTNSKNRFPSGHGVRAYDRVNSFEHLAYIFRGAAFRAVDPKAILFGGLIELRLGVFGRQRIQKALQCRRDAVIQFVSGCPECICGVVMSLVHWFCVGRQWVLAEDLPPPVSGSCVSRSRA